MGSVEPYNGRSSVSTRDARQMSRIGSRQEASSLLRQHDVEIQTDLAIGKIDNVTLATGSGLHAVVTIASAQQQYEMLAPGASGRLAHIADMHMLGVEDTLADLRHRLRRI